MILYQHVGPSNPFLRKMVFHTFRSSSLSHDGRGALNPSTKDAFSPPTGFMRVFQMSGSAGKTTLMNESIYHTVILAPQWVTNTRRT